MARTLDTTAHAIRRDSFVDSAQRLITTTGYEEMSIQAVLDDVGASKGAFYHYFDSKAALLDAVVARMVDQASMVMTPIVSDPDLLAMDKLGSLFGAMARWKWQRSELVIALLRVWQADENAIVREKFRRRSAATMGPMLASIVAQGVAEGAFEVAHPEHTARVLWAILAAAGDTASDLYLECHAGSVTFDQVEATLVAYPQACERLLGLPAGAFPFIDRESLRAWFA